MKKTLFAAVGLLALCLSPSVQANLVINGDFETASGCGPVTGWTGGGAFTNNNANACELIPDAPGAHAGDWYAAFGSLGGLDFINQNVTTIAGRTYTFSFWLAGDLGTPNRFTASLDGQVVFDQSNIAGNTYALHSFSFVAVDDLTTIRLGGRNDPTWLHLDDVSFDLASPNAVPEPATLGLLGVALAALSASRRRKQS